MLLTAAKIHIINNVAVNNVISTLNKKFKKLTKNT